jgi:hypothetical protein
VSSYQLGDYKTWPEERKEKSRASFRRNRLARRKQLDEMKLSIGCVDCNYNKHPAALQWDHRPGKEKLFDISQNPMRRWSKMLIEIDKCDVRCANCHAIVTQNRK